MEKLLLVLLLLLLLPNLWFGGKIALYEQEDNAEKLASKQDYLHSIQQLDSNAFLNSSVVTSSFR